MKRVYEVNPLECPDCGSEMAIIAFIRDPTVVHRILDHLAILETSDNNPLRSPPDEGFRPSRPTIIYHQVMNCYRIRKISESIRRANLLKINR